MNKKSLTFIVVVILFGFLLTVGNLVWPNATKIVLNFLWFLLLSMVILFVTMGILVVFGMKKEVGKLLDMLLEGSMSIMDFINFLREVVILFVKRIKEILLFLTPFLSYVLAATVYLMVLYLYKLVGKYYDVTLLTVFLTMLMVVAVGLFNMPTESDIKKIGWRYDFAKRLKDSFSDALEVVIFIFFITMDSTHLFYVPAELNIPLHAQFMQYDFMERGFRLDQARVTLIVITVAIISETVRSILRIVVVALKYYRQSFSEPSEFAMTDNQKYLRIKQAIRKSFAEAKDDLVKLISFTTILVSVFLLFPRLKLFSMAMASLTVLAMDLVIPARLSVTKGKDLVSRVLEKALRL